MHVRLSINYIDVEERYENTYNLMALEMLVGDEESAYRIYEKILTVKEPHIIIYTKLSMLKDMVVYYKNYPEYSHTSLKLVSYHFTSNDNSLEEFLMETLENFERTPAGCFWMVY